MNRSKTQGCHQSKTLVLIITLILITENQKDCAIIGLLLLCFSGIRMESVCLFQETLPDKSFGRDFNFRMDFDLFSTYLALINSYAFVWGEVKPVVQLNICALTFAHDFRGFCNGLLFKFIVPLPLPR